MPPDVLQPVTPSIEDMMRLLAEEDEIEYKDCYVRKFWLRDKLPTLTSFGNDDGKFIWDKNSFKEKDPTVERNRKRRVDIKRQLYTYNNYVGGRLEKLEAIRGKSIAIKSLEEYMMTLYLLGFSIKRIFFAVMTDHKKYGIPCLLSFTQVKAFLENEWQRHVIKKEFDESLKEERMQIFQSLHAEVREAEKAALKIYIKKIEQLTEHLETLDPIEDRDEMLQIRKDINMLVKDVNDAHGITDARKVTVSAAGDAIKDAFANKLALMDKDEGSNVYNPTTVMGTMLDADSGAILLDGK